MAVWAAGLSEGASKFVLLHDRFSKLYIIRLIEDFLGTPLEISKASSWQMFGLILQLWPYRLWQQ